MDRVLLTLLLIKAALFGAVVCFAPGVGGDAAPAPQVVQEPAQQMIQDAVSELDDVDDAV
jgi:hypothetical protein